MKVACQARTQTTRTQTRTHERSPTRTRVRGGLRRHQTRLFLTPFVGNAIKKGVRLGYLRGRVDVLGGYCACGVPVGLFGLTGVRLNVKEIHTMRASVGTVPLKPPPAHLRATSTGPWLDGMAMEVAEWLRLLGVPSGDEDKQHDIIRNIEREAIDVEAMMGLTEENRKELGFRMGGRSKIRLGQRRGAVAVAPVPVVVAPRTTPASEPVALCPPPPSRYQYSGPQI